MKKCEEVLATLITSFDVTILFTIDANVDYLKNTEVSQRYRRTLNNFDLYQRNEQPTRNGNKIMILPAQAFLKKRYTQMYYPAH